MIYFLTLVIYYYSGMFRVTVNKDVRTITMTTTYNSDIYIYIYIIIYIYICVCVCVFVCVYCACTYLRATKNINFRLR